MNTVARQSGLSAHDQLIASRAKRGENRFFPQFKSKTVRNWVYAVPVRFPYGHKTIEECQEVIDKNEREDIRAGRELCDWRIKEEIV